MQQIQPKSSFGPTIGLIAVVAIVLMVVMAAFGPGTKGGNAWQYLTSGSTGNSASQAPASGSSIVGGPSLSAQKIDTILANAGSPAAGSGQALYDLSAQYNVDDAFALGVFQHESGYGTRGVARQSLSLGNLRCIDGYACQGGYAYFNSWQEGYRAFYALISGPLYVKAGLTTTSAIMPRYAPSEDSNDPVGYANAVEQSMAVWRAS